MRLVKGLPMVLQYNSGLHLAQLQESGLILPVLNITSSVY